MRHTWTTEEENLLIGEVARSLRDGGTIGEGLLSAAMKLKRTPGACRFRLYSALSGDERTKEIDEAKKERYRRMMEAFARVEG